jgi:hypothetical protein
MLVDFSDISQEDKVIYEHKLKSTLPFALQACHVLITRSVASNDRKVVFGVRDSVANTNVVSLSLSCLGKKNPVIKKMNANKSLRLVRCARYTTCGKYENHRMGSVHLTASKSHDSDITSPLTTLDA